MAEKGNEDHGHEALSNQSCEAAGLRFGWPSSGKPDVAFFLLRHALHATLLAGEPALLIPDAVQMFVLYAIFSFVGWLLVGVPTALLLPADFITRLSWPFALIVGAMLGPPALLVIFALLGRGHIYFRNFAEAGTLFAYSILVSTVSFMVYLALLRKEMKSKPVPSQRFSHQS